MGCGFAGIVDIYQRCRTRYCPEDRQYDHQKRRWISVKPRSRYPQNYAVFNLDFLFNLPFLFQLVEANCNFTAVFSRIPKIVKAVINFVVSRLDSQRTDFRGI
jgi:hypothetical protein